MRFSLFCFRACSRKFINRRAHVLIESCMASSASSLSPLATDFGVRGSVLAYLKLEGLAVAGLAAVLYAHLGASWWLFVAVWLVPDLSMLGYLAGSCWGARIYNVVHSYVLPIALGLTALLLHAQALLPLALIWANHIGVDRMLGYGLKYSNGFGWTHLGKLGKKNVSTAAE